MCQEGKHRGGAWSRRAPEKARPTLPRNAFRLKTTRWFRFQENHGVKIDPTKNTHEFESTPAPFAYPAKGCGTRNFNFQELQTLRRAHPPGQDQHQVSLYSLPRHLKEQMSYDPPRGKWRSQNAGHFFEPDCSSISVRKPWFATHCKLEFPSTLSATQSSELSSNLLTIRW